MCGLGQFQWFPINNKRASLFDLGSIVTVAIIPSCHVEPKNSQIDDGISRVLTFSEEKRFQEKK